MNKETRILDFNNRKVKSVLEEITKGTSDEKEIINACYVFVRDEIKFGYNESDDIPVSKVLKDGYGQCNTKSNLLLALLKGAGIEARFHGFTIDKRLQYGAVTGVFYMLTPQEIYHSWIEVKHDGKWYNLEGFILDNTYLESLQRAFPSSTETLCGYGVASNSFQEPQVDWNGSNSTYIQKEGIVRDLGVFESPDEFYLQHGTNPKGFRKIIFKYLVRHLMNRNISNIRNGKVKSNMIPKTMCLTKDIEAIKIIV